MGSLSCRVINPRNRIITTRHWLLPTSYSSIANSLSYDRACQRIGRCRGFPRSTRRSIVGLGACFRPGSFWGRENVPNNRFPTSITYLVQACQPSLACCDLRSLTQIQISSPYQLPSAYPAHGCQEGCPLTIIAPGQNGPLLHCQDRSLFRSLGSSDDTDGPIRVWATLSRNFVSHISNSHRTG